MLDVGQFQLQCCGLGVQNGSKKHSQTELGAQGSLGGHQVQVGLILKLLVANVRALPQAPKATSLITPRANFVLFLCFSHIAQAPSQASD